MDGWMDRRMDGWMNGWMMGWMRPEALPGELQSTRVDMDRPFFYWICMYPHTNQDTTGKYKVCR